MLLNLKQKKNALPAFFFCYPKNLRRKKYYRQNVRKNHESVENIRDVPDYRKFKERTENRSRTKNDFV